MKGARKPKGFSYPRVVNGEKRENMKTMESPYILIMIAAAAFCLFIAVYVLRQHRKNSETVPLLLMLGLIVEWIAAALLGLVAQNLAHKLLWAKFEYIGVVSVPLAVLVYVVYR